MIKKKKHFRDRFFFSFLVVFFCRSHVLGEPMLRCTFECQKKIMYPVSLCLFMWKSCKDILIIESEMKRQRGFYHKVYFEESTNTPVPNRMRMCTRMHALATLDALR